MDIKYYSSKFKVLIFEDFLQSNY